MSWNNLPAQVQELVEATLTAKQLEAFMLETNNPTWGIRRIAQELDIVRSAADDRIRNAHRNLRLAGLTQDGSGRWHLQSEEAA